MSLEEKSAEILYRDLDEADTHIFGDDYTFRYYIGIRLKELNVCLVVPFDYTAYEYSEDKEEYKKRACCVAISKYLSYLYRMWRDIAPFYHQFGYIGFGFYVLPIERYKWLK